MPGTTHPPDMATLGPRRHPTLDSERCHGGSSLAHNRMTGGPRRFGAGARNLTGGWNGNTRRPRSSTRAPRGDDHDGGRGRQYALRRPPAEGRLARPGQRSFPVRDGVGPARRLHVQLPVLGRCRQRVRYPGGLPLRDRRADDLLGRLRPDGQEAACCRRHVHLRQSRPRLSARPDVRPVAGCGVHAVRGLAHRRVRRVLAGCAGQGLPGHHPRGRHPLDLPRARRHRRRHADGLLRHPALGQDPGCRTSDRARHHPHLHGRRVRDGWQRRRVDRSGPAVECLPGHGSRAGHLHRVLVMGRLRGRAQLRRGVEGSGPHHPDRRLCLVHLRRHPLHARVLGLRVVLRARQPGVRGARSRHDSRLRRIA